MLIIFNFALEMQVKRCFCLSVVAKKKTKLTHLSFNPIYPLVVAGDDR